MSNRKKLKNRRELKAAAAARPRITVTEENKEEAAALLGYSVESIDDALQQAKAEGFRGVSFPIPPRS